MTKSGTGSWELGREDLWTPGRGTQGCGTQGCRDGGLRDVGRRDSGTSEAQGCDKQHLKFALNLKFTIFGGQENGIV